MSHLCLCWHAQDVLEPQSWIIHQLKRTRFDPEVSIFTGGFSQKKHSDPVTFAPWNSFAAGFLCLQKVFLDVGIERILMWHCGSDLRSREGLFVIAECGDTFRCSVCDVHDELRSYTGTRVYWNFVRSSLCACLRQAGHVYGLSLAVLESEGDRCLHRCAHALIRDPST